MVSECVCKTAHPTLAPKGDGVVRLRRETKGRKGKGVTLITDLVLPDAELNAMAKQLKAKCGVGGSCKSGVIELQTSDREKVQSLLQTLLESLHPDKGYKVRIAGG